MTDTAMTNAPATPAQRLIAHRGWQARRVENTLDAVAAAIAAGARHIEIDVQLSADQQPVLFHDRDLGRLAGLSQPVHALGVAELAELTLREPSRPAARMAQLAEVAALLQPHPPITLYVELKRIALRQFGADRVLQAVAAACATIRAQVVLISFDPAVLVAARQQGWDRVGPVINAWPQWHSPQLAALNPDVVFVDVDCVPRDARLDTMPWPAAVYEVGHAAAARAWFARGAALVETFDIGGLIAALAED
ncbi:MAG TPA: glycerophosphodiester phosphodiesterase family protein [Spongiibacteraceae bacterium]|jgi:glycerophosphoryl diester phosphodiesterase|nr:glycerophosphodiester phosphodiesterase family protein [Spongiibacteraceae bacterium]HUH38068.1 glycerophosphodiester phosphodiesterase family protein [Spongiibacteraceae bacterium]